jgi:hypothetical protein
MPILVPEGTDTDCPYSYQKGRITLPILAPQGTITSVHYHDCSARLRATVYSCQSRIYTSRPTDAFGYHNRRLLHAPHGAICAALLPHCVVVNVLALENRVMVSDPTTAKKFLKRYEDVARAVTGDESASVGDGVQWMKNLVKDCGVLGLGAMGLKESDFDEVIAKSKESSSMKGNPVALTDDELRDMLKAAL